MFPKRNKWIEERKDEYLRDAIRQFFAAYLTFKQEYKQFKKEGRVKFSHLAEWIGTEENKGPLWKLKDLVHSLLDEPHKIITPQIAFERSIHLIFHQFMSFKEHTYVLEQYESIATERYKGGDEELSEASREFRDLMEKTKKEMPEEMESSKELFETSLKLLKLLLLSYKENKLVVRYIVENKSMIEQVYGKGEWERILALIFPEGKEEAFYITAKWYFENGDYDIAKEYTRKALSINPENSKIKSFLKKVSAFSR